MERSLEQGLVNELSGDSVNAFNELYRQYCHRLFNFAFSLLKDRDSAEEVVQHVFLKIWEKRSTLNPGLPFQSYVFTITKNYILQLLQRRLRNRNFLEELHAHSPDPTDNAGAELHFSELKKKARKEITHLPCQRQNVFIMSRRLNLTNREIAERLNISVHTVKRHMNMALHSLNQALINP